MKGDSGVPGLLVPGPTTGESHCTPVYSVLPVAGGGVLSPTVLLSGGTVVGLVAAKVVAMLTVVLMVGGASEGLVTWRFPSVTFPGFAVVGCVVSVLLPVV